MAPCLCCPWNVLPLLLGLILLLGLVSGECERRILDCDEGNCVQKVECLHGRCGADGACDCLPCYSGPTCASYDDKYDPRFAIPEATVIINANHVGVVYKAAAEDEDLGLTCPLGPGRHTRCPCAAITYSLPPPPHPLFTIHESSGQVFLREGAQLSPGSRHHLKIIASSTNDSRRHDHQTLTVLVHRDDHLHDLLRQEPAITPLGENTERWKAEQFNASRYLAAQGGAAQVLASEDNPSNDVSDIDEQSQDHARRKRYAFGATNDYTAVNISLNRVGTPPPAEIRPGTTVQYEAIILLPSITTPMQLVVEVFAMDPVSGNTAFALCDPRVASIGTMIKKGDGTALTVNNVPAVTTKSSAFSHVIDRAYFDFGLVLNGDTYATGQTDFTDSTINITFSATLITNPAYTNTTAVVTIGAQYNSDTFVYVGTDEMNYSMVEDTYTPQVTIDAPTSVAQYAAATIVLDAYINHPFNDLLLQVYTPSITGYDTFSISNIGVSKMGDNFECSAAPVVTYYPSVSNMTNIMAEYTMKLLTKNIIYPLGTDHQGNPDFLMRFYINVFAMKAAVGASVDVSVGLLMSLTSVFTGTVHLSVTAGVIPEAASGSGTWSALTALTSTNVEVGRAVTWAATMTLSSPANIELTCTLTATTGNEVCGIMYGTAGANIALLPDLSRYLVFTVDASQVTFTLFFNSTGKVTDAGANDLQFEFSINVITPQADVTVTCSQGLSTTVSATSFTGSLTKDVKASVSSITPLDTVWYVGSQAGLLLKLSFPDEGIPYTTLHVESVAGVDQTTWGARTCGGRVVSAGRAVPCVAGRQFAINKAVQLTDSLLGRPFVDTTKMTLGSACGTERTGATTDLQVLIELYFDMPVGQTGIVNGHYNLSVGVALDTRLIWTSWEDTTLSNTQPAYDSNDAPTFAFLTDSIPTTGIETGVPQIIQVVLRTVPQSAMHYRITAAVGDTSIISLCLVMILEVGDNFPCVDHQPYDKENVKYQPTTLVHDTEWGLSAVLDLGVLKNLGSKTFVAGAMPDENSVVVGVMVKGVAAGSGTLKVTLDSSGTLTPLTQTLTVAAVTPNLGLTSIIPKSVDGTADAYEGAMKMVDFVVQVPVGYKNTITATITNVAVADITLCFGAVLAVGKNLPCVIPAQIIGSKTVTPTSEVYVVAVKEVCHYPFIDNQTESQFTLRFGAMFLAGSGTAATLSLVVKEGSVNLSPKTFDLNKVAGVYIPPPANVTLMWVTALDTPTSTVTPGMQLWAGVALTVPKGATTAVEFGVMTTSDGGRAYATLHDFRIPTEGQGKNIGCILTDNELYSRVLAQNSSQVTPMIHTSQTDTLIVNLKYLTNTGLTYEQRKQQPEDDQVWLEALVTIADHPNATNGAIIPVHFAVKTGEGIYVTTKNLTLDKTTTPVIVTTKELFLTDNSTTLFSQGETVPLTLRVRHSLNESSQEVNKACVRVLMPKYLKYVNTTDTFLANISGVLTANDYLDYCFGYLFFSDNLEANFTLTVDPNKEMPPALGVVNATTLHRLLGSTNTATTIKYFGETAFVVYEVKSLDVYNPLNMSLMQACQFTALGAMDPNTLPEMARPGSGGGWSPPVTVGASWHHYLTIDFLKKTRVTRIIFQEVTGKLSLKTFRLQYSQSGISFSENCKVEVPTTGVVDLPTACCFEARFFRVVVLTAGSGLGGTETSQENTALGVRFKDWYGDYLEQNTTSCTTTFKTRISNDPAQWRSAAYDSTNAVFYFCDVSVKREEKGSEMVCFSTPDGAKWSALPSYIGWLVGHDATRGMMCAVDKSGSALVCSKDGLQWSIMADADHAAIKSSATPPTAVPGLPSGALTTVTLSGGWSADFTGVAKSGTYHAKWANCCS